MAFSLRKSSERGTVGLDIDGRYLAAAPRSTGTSVRARSPTPMSSVSDAIATCRPVDGLPSPPATNHPSAYGRVNPYNPCLPATWARTCDLHPSFGDAGAPFDDSPNWYSLN
jgi:hypothetical protein